MTADILTQSPDVGRFDVGPPVPRGGLSSVSMALIIWLWFTFARNPSRPEVEFGGSKIMSDKTVSMLT